MANKTIKVTMTDNYSGRSLSFRIPSKKWEALSSWVSKWDWMSHYQRKKAEIFFGKVMAYYTSVTFE